MNYPVLDRVSRSCRRGAVADCKIIERLALRAKNRILPLTNDAYVTIKPRSYTDHETGSLNLVESSASKARAVSNLRDECRARYPGLGRLAWKT